MTTGITKLNNSLESAMDSFNAGFDRFERDWLTQTTPTNDWGDKSEPWAAILAKSVVHGVARTIVGAIQIVAFPVIFALGVFLSPIFGTKIMKFGLQHFGHGCVNVLRGVLGEMNPFAALWFVSEKPMAGLKGPNLYTYDSHMMNYSKIASM